MLEQRLHVNAEQLVAPLKNELCSARSMWRKYLPLPFHTQVRSPARYGLLVLVAHGGVAAVLPIYFGTRPSKCFHCNCIPTEICETVFAIHLADPQSVCCLGW